MQISQLDPELAHAAHVPVIVSLLPERLIETQSLLVLVPQVRVLGLDANLGAGQNLARLLNDSFKECIASANVPCSGSLTSRWTCSGMTT